MAGDRLDGVLTDLSFNGAFIKCSPPPPLLARLSLRFELVGYGATSAIGLVIRRTTGATPGVGILFEALPVGARQELVKLVRELGGADFRVLVVEDSETMRRMIVDSLRRLEIEQVIDIIEAGDGVAGMKQLMSSRFDLMILDINLPQMDGLKLASLARNDPNHRHIHIMVITAERSTEDTKAAENLGVGVYLTKPVQKAQVIDAVRGLLKL
jgi:two-component system, chemotaxis family, chemotaxis protein CheY